MKMTRASDYAVRCALYLSKKGAGVVVSRREISKAMGIPSPFLGKIAQKLAKAGVIEIIQGARGGYRLKREPTTVSLLQIIEAVTGEIILNECLSCNGACRRQDHCSVHPVWSTVRDQMRWTLEATKMSDLL
jgi:Rrf2 family protein